MPRLTDYLTAYGACNDSIEYCQKGKSIDDIWDNCERGDWMLWFATLIGVHPDLILKARVACVERVRDVIAAHSPVFGKVLADLVDMMIIVAARTNSKGMHEYTEYQDCVKTIFEIAKGWPRHFPFIFPDVVFNGISIEITPTNASALAYEVAKLEEAFGAISKEESLRKQADICRSVLSSYVKDKTKEIGLIV